MITISKLAASVQPSATLAAGAKARQLRAKGIHVYDYSLGEPDFPTPAHICEAATQAMRDGHTHYTPVNGVPELRAAISRWYQKRYGYEFSPDLVMVSNGAKQSIHNALIATCNPGDEVIIPIPYWVSYSDLVSMTGAVPVYVNTTAASQFKMTPEQFRAAITPRTKMVMMNSPCNPTGTVYTRDELSAIADIVIEKNLILMSDEIYEQLVFDGLEATCMVTLRPELRERTITISGASKGYAMTGWRMGWSIAPENVTKAMNTVQSQETSCPSSISQYALIAALDGSHDCVEEMRREFDLRRQMVCEKLAAIPLITFPKPQGAFYVFFDVSGYFGQTRGGVVIQDSQSFCLAALEQAHVNLVPGIAFGAEGFARMSYATSREQLEGGLRALHSWLVG